MADVNSPDDNCQLTVPADMADQRDALQLAQLAVDDGQEEEGAPVDGSQYSSEGKPYELKEYELYSEIDRDNGANAGPELVMLVVDEPAVGSAEVAFQSINDVPPEKEKWT
jgi:hypothetical protein